MSEEIWLLETGKQDPEAFRNYDDGVKAFITWCRGADTLEEIAAELDEDGWGYEFNEGGYLYVDDGPSLYRITLT